MPGALPPLYFRLRENGAQVFRVTDDARTRRLELEPLAVVNVAKGDIRPQGDRTPTEAERAEIAAWLAARQAEAPSRALDDAQRLIEQLGQAAHWAQARASDDQIAAIADDLMLAMHDLRGVLVRRKAEALAGPEGPGTDG